MIIVIDAYNLLRALPPHSRKITDQERKKFLAQVGRYGRMKGHKMVVVFDGGPYEWPSKERVNGVHVVYSGVNETADDYIKEYLDAHKERDMLLVSSDNELNFRADQFNIPSIGSFHFYELMQESLQGKKTKTVVQDKAVKITETESEELDQLMEQASRVMPIKSEDLVREVAGDVVKKKPSKEERKLLSKLKKL